MCWCKVAKDKEANDVHQVDDDEDTKQLPLVKDETRGGRRHPQKQGSAIDLDIGEPFPLYTMCCCSLKSKLGKVCVAI